MVVAPNPGILLTSVQPTPRILKQTREEATGEGKMETNSQPTDSGCWKMVTLRDHEEET